ncbi:type VI secretion system tube protein TssD [Thermodesulfobacteriota bacterium]
MAMPVHMTISDIAGPEENDIFLVQELHHEVYNVVDPDTGQSVEETRHRGLTILKSIDDATPLLYKSLDENLKHEVKIEFWKNTPDDDEKKKVFYTITMKSALIQSIKPILPSRVGGGASDKGWDPLEEVTFTYTTISFATSKDHEIVWIV